MAICILVVDHEEKAYQLWEKLQINKEKISNFELIEPNLKENSFEPNQSQKNNLPKRVKINEVKLLNPKISREERQRKMAKWLMPFGFVAGLTFSGMTDLSTFSDLGFNSASEPIIGGLLGMASGWIGSFFAARSVSNNQEDDLKDIFKRNKQGAWLILLETPLEIDLPWPSIKEIDPSEIINLNLI